MQNHFLAIINSTVKGKGCIVRLRAKKEAPPDSTSMPLRGALSNWKRGNHSHTNESGVRVHSVNKIYCFRR